MKQETNLARLRKAAGMSQSQLSMATGIPQGTIARWECRSRSVNGAAGGTLRRIAEVLDCSMEGLLEDEEEN